MDGHLVRVQSPWPDFANASGGVRSERFYYDGARRIQELVTDPIATIELLETPEGAGNNPEQSELMNQTIPGGTSGGDGSANPMNFESGLLENPNTVIGSSGTPLPTSLSGLEREYVWGPGDNGLDEILVQYDVERKPFWMIQDGGGDVVAMCDLQGSGGTARVVKSWQYDAYGQCLRATDVVASTSGFSIPLNRIGHKGLFMDRLDVGLANGNLADNPRLAPFSTVLYQNRNRTYSPQLGRFIQRDPNESGQFVAAMEGYHGQMNPDPDVLMDMSSLYVDGGSAHQYLGSRCWSGRDPSGLFMSLIGTAMGSTALLDMYVDYNDDVWDYGSTAAEMAVGMAQTAALNQRMDMDWALDWSAGDSDYSGSAEAIGEFGAWAPESTLNVAPPAQTIYFAGMTPSAESIIPKWLPDPGRTPEQIISKAKEAAGGKNVRGVYLIYKGDTLIYVGRSSDMAKRAAQSLADKGGTAAKFIPCSSKAATRALEDYLIRGAGMIGKGKNLVNGIDIFRKKTKAGSRYKALQTAIMRGLCD